MLYTSIKNEKIKNIKKLQDKKYRDQSNHFLVEGDNLIKEAEKNNLLQEIFVLENYEIATKVPVNYVTDKVMQEITNLKTPPKVIGIANKKSESKVYGRVLILDNIQDPGNLGTIIRSCVAFNIDTLILSDDTVDLYNPKVIRATQGMIFNLNILIRNLETEIPTLKELGYTIYGTDVQSGKNIKSIEKNNKFAIIMGSEGKGMHDSIKPLCDSFIYIKMNQQCESLNVGVATSIILYELDK